MKVGCAGRAGQATVLAGLTREESSVHVNRMQLIKRQSYG
jgi:hypothetical protein